MKELCLVLGMTIVTFGVRYPVLALLGRFNLPAPLLRALKFVPAAVLTAIIVPAVVLPGGTMDLHPGNAFLAAGVVAVLISWKTKKLTLTILGGMAFFFLWRALF